MNVRNFALIAGIVYLLIGILGFIPGLVAAPPSSAPNLSVDAGYGLLLGLFPVNIVHNIVHLLVGIGGLIAYRTFDAARSYSKIIGIVFAALFIMGLVPGLNTLFGLAPLFSHDIWLHGLTALAGLYFGFAAAPRRTAVYP